MKLMLVIFSTDAKLIQSLESQAAHLSYLSFAVGNGPTITKTKQLDALKISQMDAVERYGFNPPHPLLEARVLKTPESLVTRGLPRYAISGVALSTDYPRNTGSELELIISATFKAVTEFNSAGQDQILRIGMLPESLTLDKLPAKKVFEILERIYEEIISSAD